MRPTNGVVTVHRPGVLLSGLVLVQYGLDRIFTLPFEAPAADEIHLCNSCVTQTGIWVRHAFWLLGKTFAVCVLNSEESRQSPSKPPPLPVTPPLLSR